jgi:hypothetical protein
VQRRQGIGFDQAWSVAIAEVPNSGWRTRDVVASTREAWRRAYLRQPPTAAERKLLRVRQALAELEAEQLEREQLLPRPGLPPPKDGRPRNRNGNGTGRGRKPSIAGHVTWR